MVSFLPRPIEMAVSTLLIALFAAPGPLMAQTHVVNSAEVQKQVLATSQTRLHNEETVQQFVSSPQAEKAIKAAGMDPERVKVAVPTLSDQELSQIALRTEKAQADFAAGRIGDRDLLLILVGVVVLILIIVAVR
ncbi:MAG TPA: PA2779 family protein [Candidatus Saccharimonadales bacterium]|nr:PA2779 family protein [Candidatus Saccharimonadales bacterium]